MSVLIARQIAFFAPPMSAARIKAGGERMEGESGEPTVHALNPYALDAGENLSHKAIKIAAVGMLHIGLAAWLVNTEFREPEVQAPIRLDVRTVEILPSAVTEMKQAITDAPKPLPVAPKPLPVAPKPLPVAPKPIAPRPKHTSAPRVLQAAPGAEPAASDFSIPAAPFSPPAMAEQEPQVSTASMATTGPAGNAVRSAARFDADYLRNPAPAYPPMSRRQREEGEVLLDVRVTAEGRAEHVRIRQGSGYARLDEAALGTVQHWRFVPARLGNEPVAATVLVPIKFRLDH